MPAKLPLLLTASGVVKMTTPIFTAQKCEEFHGSGGGQNISELPKKLTLNKLALIGEAEKSP